MAYALYHDKLWSVHLNDQNGLKYDQDKVFGSVDLRRAFNQVWVLEKNGYGKNGEMRRARRQGDANDHVRGVDVSPRRTRRRCSSACSTSFAGSTSARSRNSRPHRQYEQLEMLILNALMGRKS